MTKPTQLHPDFADLVGTTNPGVMSITARPDLFHLVNLVTFGGDAARATHIPAELGRVGTVALWESTGAQDHLPFWHTNYDGDAYLYLVHGSVRVEFKQTDTETRYGHYLARTGDLFRLPAGVAHRTYSGDGKRRITLEIMPHNPFWDMIGKGEGSNLDDSARAGSFTFRRHADSVEVSAGDAHVTCPRADFDRGVSALIAYEMHLGHVEFDGGFTVHDLGEKVRLTIPGTTGELATSEVLAIFRGLLT
jgi:mannose-6-phosphate isomerase-like protein (cupin superfamily)